jgi:hypothetical protein
VEILEIQSMKRGAAAVASLLFLAPILRAQPQPIIEDVKRLVVYVSCEARGELTPMMGGLIVGLDSTRLYVATADHGRSNCPEGRFRVKPYRSERWISAEALHFRDTGLDLFVLMVPRDGLPNSASYQFRVLGQSGLLATGSAVRPIGFPGAQEWHVDARDDRVSQRQFDRIDFDSGVVRQGSSGGPLLDGGGRIVGLVRWVVSSRATATPIEAVLQRLQSWDVPVRLTLAEGPDRPTGCALPPQDALRFSNTLFVMPDGFTRSRSERGDMVLMYTGTRSPYYAQIIIEPGGRLEQGFREAFERELGRAGAINVGPIQAVDTGCRGFRALQVTGELRGDFGRKVPFIYFAANPGDRFEQITLIGADGYGISPAHTELFRRFIETLDYENMRATRPVY